MSTSNKPRVAVLYTHYPHYRGPVFEAMIKSENYSYDFYFSNHSDFSSIKPHQTLRKHTILPMVSFFGLQFQFGFIRHLLFGKYSALIFLGNPNIISMWIYAAIARIFHKKVLFWTHGWLKAEFGLKGFLRMVFYSLGNGMLLYGNRAKSIGINKGYPEEKMSVIYNSLNYSAQKKERQYLEALGENNNEKSYLYIVCIARLTNLVRLDLAIKALCIIRQSYALEIPLILIGDGPEKASLERLAFDLGVDLIIKGELYNEEEIAKILYFARAVVSPGKVGLTAMHALAYGIPVITHSNFNKQMPEVEAIIPGLTGDFFVEGDEKDLSKVLYKWITKPSCLYERNAAISVIEEKYNSAKQLMLIEQAINKILE